MMEVNQAIKSRRTVKVLGNVEQPHEATESRNDLIREMITTAGWAPYHYACHKSHREGELNSIVPWRFHVLDSATCRKLLNWLLSNNIDSGKIAQMLAVAETLVMATWLPDIDENKEQLFDPSVRNMEHISAASAAIQNLLLAATSNGITNYWSSGGVLREKELFEYLGIRKDEILLGAVFLFPEETADADVVGGKLSDLRGDVSGWSRLVKIK